MIGNALGAWEDKMIPQETVTKLISGFSTLDQDADLNEADRRRRLACKGTDNPPLAVALSSG